MANPIPKLSVMKLPVGFIFNPKDVDLVTFYLKCKLGKTSVAEGAITDFDVYSHDPEHLPGKFTHGHGRNAEIFFSRRQRSSIKGIRAKRLVASRDGTHIGHWHGNKDEPIYSDNVVVGLKTSLTFARSTGRRGEKDFPTDWIMHEFRLPGSGFQEYAICKVFNKNANYKRKGNFLQKAGEAARYSEHGSFMSRRGNLTIREPRPDQVRRAPVDSTYRDPAFGYEDVSSMSVFLNSFSVPRQNGLLWDPEQPARFPGNCDMGKDFLYMVREEEEDFELQYSNSISLPKAVSPIHEDPPMLPLTFTNNHGISRPPTPPGTLPKETTTMEEDIHA